MGPEPVFWKSTEAAPGGAASRSDRPPSSLRRRAASSFMSRMVRPTARKSDITAEVERLAPLVEEGGYIPFCDHLVPPDVPLSNYVHYLNEAKRVWGRELDNLQATGEPEWGNAEFKEADGYIWDPKELGLAAE